MLCVCIFKGRQMAHPEHGYDVMRQVAADLADISKVEMPAKMMGRRMTMLLSPLPLTQRRAAAKEREQKKRDAEIARERGEDVPED